MPVRFLSCFVVLCVVVSIACNPRSSWAEEERKPGIYVDGGASLYALKLPGYAPLMAFDLGPFTGISRITVRDDMAMGPLGSLTLGWRTDTPLFFELSGRFFEATDHGEGDYPASRYGATRVGFLSPSGMNALMGTTETAHTNLKSLFHESGGRLVGGYALDLGGGVTVSPFAGCEIMRIDQDYRLDFHDSTNANFWMNLHEDVGSVYKGLVAGARLQVSMGQWLGTLSGSVARYRVSSGYEGAMKTNNYNDNHSLHTVDYATGLECSVALDRRLGPWTLGLQGGYRNLSYVPEIVASSYSAANTVSTYDGRPTYLSGYESRAYTLGLHARYTF